LAEARREAIVLVAALRPACQRIEIAGSIRRRRSDIGDIEILAVPTIDWTETGDLWGTNREIDLLQETIDDLLADGTLQPHPADPKRGPRYAKFIHAGSGLQLDLFITTADQFGLLLLIRTGPAAYSQWLVTEARRRGYHVAGGHLHRGGLGCGAYVCEAIPTPDEADVYAALGLPFVEPGDRR